MEAATDQLSKVYGALAHPVRREILTKLAQGEARVGDIARDFDISGPAVTNHLHVLERAGLVARRVQAQARILSLEPEGLREGEAWIGDMRRFWKHSLDRLAEHLGESRQGKRRGKKKGRT